MTKPASAEDVQEDEIHFGVLTDHIIHHYRLLNLELTRLHARIFQGTMMESGVGKLTALSMISYNEGINQVMISKAIRRDKAAVARILHELETEGLIVRRTDPSTRRANKLTITEAGKNALQEYQRLTTECEGEFTSMLTDAERSELLQLLRKMRRHHSPDAPGT